MVIALSNRAKQTTEDFRIRRTEQELKENLAKYWQQLNRHCGIPDGTHPDDPNPPQHSNPQPKTETAPYAPASAYPSFEDVYGALCADPEAMAVFQDHQNDVFKPHDMGPPPADTHGQLRWYILRDLNMFHHKRHRRDFEDAKKFRVRQRVEAIFGRLAHYDPLFKGTIQVMDHHIEHLPPSAQRAVRELFARCPHEALEFYQEMRAPAGEVAKIYHGRRTKRGS